MTTEINEDDIQRAIKEEQGVADEAHIEHLKQRVAVLRAALNNLNREHDELKAAHQELQNSHQGPQQDPPAEPTNQPSAPTPPPGGPEASSQVVQGVVVS